MITFKELQEYKEDHKHLLYDYLQCKKNQKNFNYKEELWKGRYGESDTRYDGSWSDPQLQGVLTKFQQLCVLKELVKISQKRLIQLNKEYKQQNILKSKNVKNT
jgi:hypothetical protein